MQRIPEELSQVKELLRHYHQGMSVSEIAEKIGKNKHTVGRYLEILHASGHVDLRTFGMAKVYTISSRVPLSGLLSYTTDLVMVVDTRLRILQINDSFLSLIGIDNEQIVFQNILDIQVPDPVVHTFLDVIAEQIRSAQDIDEIELATQPRRYFHLKVIPTVFDDGTGGTTVILEDITRERFAYDEVKKSQEFFEDIIKHMKDGLMVIEEGKLLYTNDRLTEITGYNPEEIAAMNPVQLAADNEKKRFTGKYMAMEEHPCSIQDFCFWSTRKDGDSRYLHTRMSANQYGDKTRHYILVSDITDTRCKQGPENIRGIIMCQMVEQFPQPVCCYRDDETIFQVNTSFCKFFSCMSTEKVTGKKLQEILPPDLYPIFISGDQEIHELGRHQVRSVLIPDPGGTIRQVSVKKTLISVCEGRGDYIFSVILTDEDDRQGLVFK